MSPSPAPSTAPSMPSWQPLTQRPINPAAQEMARSVNDEMHEVWSNDTYECQVRYLEPRGRGGAIHLSIKRWDRSDERDWRHLQSIKNEVAGWEREAFELFPRESRLIDTANQTHLWVLPATMEMPFGWQERIVATAGMMIEELRKRGASDALIAQTRKARQREWQPGLSTGPEFGRKVGM